MIARGRKESKKKETMRRKDARNHCNPLEWMSTPTKTESKTTPVKGIRIETRQDSEEKREDIKERERGGQSAQDRRRKPISQTMEFTACARIMKKDCEEQEQVVTLGSAQLRKAGRRRSDSTQASHRFGETIKTRR